jgi:hypothetical protein
VPPVESDDGPVRSVGAVAAKDPLDDMPSDGEEAGRVADLSDASAPDAGETEPTQDWGVLAPEREGDSDPPQIATPDVPYVPKVPKVADDVSNVPVDDSTNTFFDANLPSDPDVPYSVPAISESELKSDDLTGTLMGGGVVPLSRWPSSGWTNSIALVAMTVAMTILG